MEDIFAIPVGNYKDENQPALFTLAVRNFDVNSAISFANIEYVLEMNGMTIATNKPKVQMQIDIKGDEENRFFEIRLCSDDAVSIKKTISVVNLAAQIDDIIYNHNHLTPPSSPNIR